MTRIARRLIGRGVAIVLVGAVSLGAPAVVRAQDPHQQGADSAAMPHMPGMKGMKGMKGMRDTTRADTSHAMHGMPGMQGMSMASAPLGIPMSRMGSGTAWLPDASPMYASHTMLGNWNVMLHGLAYLQYDDQGSKRGDRQLGSVNWGMAMADHALAGGRFAVRAMLSAEPFTVGRRGYPLLLQSGETLRGVPLHDRQHPHDLFMEAAALYDRAVSKNVGVSLYVAPVGEPAIGPVAFPHRPSAANDPLAPIGHHWQDATHIAFGVITGGVFTRTVRVEGSIFNGREPDQTRTNFDYQGRRLDSYAGRVTINPAPRWSVSGSYAYLASPEGLHPTESVRRMSGSVLHSAPLRTGGDWSSALVYGANTHAGAPRSNSVLVETNLDLDSRNAVFGRAEVVQKSREDLAIPFDEISGVGPGGVTGADHQLSVGELTLGYARELARVAGGSIAVGAAGTVNMIPEAARAVYGSSAPLGATVFLRLRPGRMRM